MEHITSAEAAAMNGGAAVRKVFALFPYYNRVDTLKLTNRFSGVRSYLRDIRPCR